MTWDPAFFRDWLIAQGCSSGTVAAYLGEAERMERSGGSPHAYVSETGLAASTLRRRRAAMAALSRFLGVEVHLPPAGVVPGARREARRLPPLPLPAPSALAALDAPAGRHRESWCRDRAMALLVLGLGLTPSRLQGLQLGDVAVEDGRAWLLVDGGASRLPVPALLRRALLSWLAVRAEPGGLDEPLFTGRRGGALPLRTLQAGLRRALAAVEPEAPGGAQGVRRSLLALACAGAGEGALTAAVLVGRLRGRRVGHTGVEALLGSLRRGPRGRV